MDKRTKRREKYFEAGRRKREARNQHRLTAARLTEAEPDEARTRKPKGYKS